MIVLHCGTREVGKSTFALRLSQWAPTRVILDPRGQFDLAAGFYLGHDGPLDAAELRHALDVEPVIVIAPRADVMGTLTTLCDGLVAWLDDHPDERVSLLLDEAHFVFPSSRTVPIESLDWLARCGSRQNVLLICTAHRPADYPTNLRAIADIWCFFQVDEPADLAAIAERCGAETAALVETLKPRQLIVRDKRGGDHPPIQVYDDPNSWYTPLDELASEDEDDRGTPAAPPPVVEDQAPARWLFP